MKYAAISGGASTIAALISFRGMPVNARKLCVKSKVSQTAAWTGDS
jgi:hypothetical protein